MNDLINILGISATVCAVMLVLSLVWGGFCSIIAALRSDVPDIIRHGLEHSANACFFFALTGSAMALALVLLDFFAAI